MTTTAISEVKPKAIYSVSSVFGIEVIELFHADSGDDCVKWRWSTEKRLHYSAIRSVGGKECFRVNRVWIALDDCFRC